MIACVWGTHYYLGHITDEMSAYLKQADDYSDTGNIKKSKEKINEFITLWNGNKNIMASFLRHAELDPVNNSSCRLLPLLEHDDIGEFSAECRTLETELSHLWESERFTLENIL